LSKAKVSPSPTLVNINRSQYIIDKILPQGEVHLIAGPSGAGKTTLVFQILAQIEQSLPVFGYASHAVPSVYIACDRSLAGIHRTLERLDNPPRCPVYSLITSPEFQDPIAQTHLGMLKQIRLLHPEAKLVLIDAIGLLLEGGNDYHKAGRFITAMTRQCASSDLTILAQHHSPKQPKDSGYANPRQRLSGSVAWAGTVETIILVEPAEEGNPENRDRTIFLCPRNDSEQKLDYTTDMEGRLVPRISDEDRKKGDIETEFDAAFNTLPSGPIHVSQLRGIFELIRVKERYGYKLIKAKLDDGSLEKIGYGGYVKR
jgi:RecA-family ATPase